MVLEYCIIFLCWASYLQYINNHYYTSDSLWKIWLVESIQSIHNSLWTWHDKRNICCRYCIYHVKFNVCLVTVLLRNKMDERFDSVSEDELCEKCIIKQLLNPVFAWYHELSKPRVCVITQSSVQNLWVRFLLLQFPLFGFRDLVKRRLICIVLCPTIVHISMCFFVTIPLSHLAIDASESLGKRYHYQQNGPQHYYLLDTLVINHQGTTGMAKGGEDWHGLTNNKTEKFSKFFKLYNRDTAPLNRPFCLWQNSSWCVGTVGFVSEKKWNKKSD